MIFNFAVLLHTKPFYDVVSGTLMRAKGNPEGIGNIFSKPETVNLMNDGLGCDK